MPVDELTSRSVNLTENIDVQIIGPADFDRQLHDLSGEPLNSGEMPLQDAVSWQSVLQAGLSHKPYLLLAKRSGKIAGALPLALVRSILFGRFLVSLPYVNSAGVLAADEEVTQALVGSAVELADQLDVRYLELRQEREVVHSALTQKNDTKVLMRCQLPATSTELWDSFKSKLRSQIRAGQKHDFDVKFGGKELLADFYAVFSQNMRDLGTPVYSPKLFAAILGTFVDRAELCVLRLKGLPVATALLVHGPGSTEVPSASSLRAFNSTSANMVMYWHLLERAITRGQKEFDFGRSTLDSNTHKFKAQWGATPHASVWQYYVRRGSIGEMRPDNSKFGLAIKVWRRLPLWVTRLLGPAIVRGIP